jgi:hypothetical protein
MDSKAVIDYIREQINAGHSEAAVRRHLAAHGWPAVSIHRAFEQYHRATMPKPAALKRVKRRRPPIPRWTRGRVIKLAVGLAVVAGVSVGVYTHWPHQKAKVPAAPPQSYSQRQSSDVVTLGGAVANYTNEHKKLPSYLSVTPDASTLYMVPGALCKDNNTLGSATDKPLAMVILYLRDNNDGSVTSRCVKL